MGRRSSRGGTVTAGRHAAKVRRRDNVGVQVDAGTGNLLVTTGDLTLPCADADTALG
ncbi:hypothetical protein [Streptomyces sp. H27-S2]|uniref:hypothetical protein n=1 Tax=Streptomyces antarcticus TaxID=2996458 RepID=UPI00226D9B51|nr:hypothetical protein [Streptomyces sp. H27-S2]MCY0953135.1 hypothetical protein [Streptomyces sp. H27-S2]